MGLKELVGEVEDIGFVARSTVVLGDIEYADKFMMYARKLFGCGGCGADCQAAVDLAAVGVENGTAEALCKL